jgi:hypothetical protein
MRGRICNLLCKRRLVRSLTTNNHALPSHLRLCSLFCPVGSRDKSSGRTQHKTRLPNIPSIAPCEPRREFLVTCCVLTSSYWLHIPCLEIISRMIEIFILIAVGTSKSTSQILTQNLLQSKKTTHIYNFVPRLPLNVLRVSLKCKMTTTFPSILCPN